MSELSTELRDMAGKWQHRDLAPYGKHFANELTALLDKHNTAIERITELEAKREMSDFTYTVAYCEHYPRDAAKRIRELEAELRFYIYR